jgi:HSP20 family protein
MQIMRRQESWDPFRELEDLSHRFQRAFGITRGDGTGREPITMMDWAPLCDVSATEKEYRVTAELPNVKKEDVHVTLADNVLTIEGERRHEEEEKGVRYHRRELTYGSFMRRFTMPEDADPAAVDATFRNGMLNVTIRKAKGREKKATEIVIH